jgi:hypothetical protein
MPKDGDGNLSSMLIMETTKREVSFLTSSGGQIYSNRALKLISRVHPRRLWSLAFDVVE